MPRRDVSSFFDAYAGGFDAIYGRPHRGPSRLVNRYLRRSMFLRYERTLAGCHPIEGRSVIDIGCGPGHYGIALARRGARRVVGIDFAPGMIALATRRAAEAGVADRCEFVRADFSDYPSTERFDYAILMGFMDYVREPMPLVDRALALTSVRAFFSFPVRSGLLAWQRRLRYRRKTDLFMYDLEDVRRLFAGAAGIDLEVERLHRDYFVTAARQAAVEPGPGSA